jgi:hypothetical protein
MSRHGNSMIPSDRQYDEYYAIRCDDCNVKLNTEELKRGDPYLCELCFEREQEIEEEEE